MLYGFNRTVLISIHAPAWGATVVPSWFVYGQHISIHAPAWGATSDVAVVKAGLNVFQSTHPRGVRLLIVVCVLYKILDFNPRTRVGCDIKPSIKRRRAERFQSTHPRGVRRGKKDKQGRPLLFQSTYPRGVRLSGGRLHSRRRAISIHAPAWGATRERNERSEAAYISIHAPAWGATSPFYPAAIRILYFNPRTRVGCDKTS